MSWIADAHREWHTVHGQNTVCPLDCGAGEVNDYDEEEIPSEEVRADYARYTGRDPWSTGEGDPWAIA